MLRPCFLVVDKEHPASISTRKLVIESAKFNVITAYSGTEAVDALSKFPNVDGVVLDAGVRDIPCSELVQQLRQLKPNVMVTLIGNAEGYPCEGADHRIESFNPKQILAFLQQLHPEEASEIDQHERALEESEG